MAKKENRRATLIALLVILVIATGAFIGTIAKYITSSTGSDSAVVAKFGLNVPNTIDLFADSYVHVQADTNGKKIIAPGTFGAKTFTVTGTSEVSYKIDAKVTVTYSEEWGEYYPLEFSLNGSEWTGIEQFKINLENALASEISEPNKPYENTQTIYWRWKLHVSEANDVKDTEMGIKAATGTAPKVVVNIEVTAMQAD